MENIQLDLAVISTDSIQSNATGKGNNNASETSKSPFFSKVLAKEQSPEKTNEKNRTKEGDSEQRSEKTASKDSDSEQGSEQGSEKITAKESNSEQMAVANGRALPEENAELPQDTTQKPEIVALLVDNELNIPAPLPEIIETSEPSPADLNIISEEDAIEIVKNQAPPENNIVPITVPTEAIETEPTLKVANTPEENIPAEAVVALNPQQIASIKPTIEPENKTTKIVQKPTGIDKLSLMDVKGDADNMPDTEVLPEASDSDTLLEEPVKPEMPAQSPIARALVKEFSDIQSNGDQQNTLRNEIGIKLGDIQTNAIKPPAQWVNNVQTSPLPAVPIEHPGWEKSFVNNVSWMSNENVQTANIRISPSDLGPLEIKMTVKQDQLSLSINTHHALTRETLENAMPRLKEMLSNNGFNSVNVDVSGQQTNGGNAENNTQTGSDWFGSDEGSEYESEQDGDDLIQSEPRMIMAGSGMVDIFA